MNHSLEFATFAGGCFWCLEAIFQNVPGVLAVTSGYSGGLTPNPSYEDICTGDTGHAEVIQLRFDPHLIRYAELLEIFFAIHDPTTPNRQGHDVGTQYRSAIFTHTEAQATCAKKTIAALEQSQTFTAPIVTEVTPAETFYPAESHHQNYFVEHRDAPYCQAVVFPKLAKFMYQFRHRTTP